MKPPSFEYVCPETVEEAVAVLDEHRDEGRILAGGQSLVPLMNFRLARPECLIDINHLTELDFIRDEGTHLSVGALTRQHAVESAALVREKCPILAEATRWIGHPATRHRGTIGGSLAHNDPSAEYPVIGALLDVDVVVRGARGRRTIPFKDFTLSYFTTSLEPGEIVVEVRVPTQATRTGWAFQEVARRHGDFALVIVAATLTMDGDLVRGARLAVGGVGPTAVRVSDAEALLRGRALDDGAISAAAETVAATVSPASDLHGSAEYRRDLCRVLTARSLKEASARAGV